jgi:hypothetical protein
MNAFEIESMNSQIKSTNKNLTASPSPLKKIPMKKYVFILFLLIIAASAVAQAPTIIEGSVAIGTPNPGSYKLAVEGKIGAREVNITTETWPDYVFKAGYQLRTLNEVALFIKEYHHLPEVPSEKEVLKNGQDIGLMNAILLKKIEELTLYVLLQEKRIAELEKAQTKLNK